MITPERSPLLSAAANIRHGFFGRQGGKSTGDFSGANVSYSVGDDADAVAANRLAIAKNMGGGPLLILKQVHSNRVETIAEPADTSTLEADAMVTKAPGLSLGILTADCTPILFADPNAGIVGAAHAGWRGAVDGVVEKTLSAMIDLGANPANIRAAYGPTIHATNYEVGDKFRADFLALHPDGAHHFHTPPGGQPHFDLPGFVAESLANAGVQFVDQVGTCTYAHPDRYFSHRYATHQKTRTGRQIAVIGLT